MGLGKMGEGTVTSDFVNKAFAGNVGFPVMLIEKLVSGRSFGLGGRVVAVSSEAVRDWRPNGGCVVYYTSFNPIEEVEIGC